MPTDYSGRRVKYGVGKETARGTAVSASYWVRWETADFFDTATTTLNQSSIGVLDKYSGAEITETSSKGQLSGKITDQTFGLLLYGAFGGYSVAAHPTETLVYDHTFTESQSNTAQSLTVVRIDPNTTLAYANAMVGSLEIDGKAGDFIRHSTQITAFPSATATATAAFIAENEFKSKDVTVKFGTDVSSVASATAIPVNNFKLTINKNVTPYYIVGQNGPSDIFATATEISGEIQLRYSDQTYYNLRFQNTKQAVQIQVLNSAVTIGTAAHPTLTLTLPAAYLTDMKVDQAQDGIVTQTISFTGTFDLTAAYAVKAVLTNTVVSY